MSKTAVVPVEDDLAMSPELAALTTKQRAFVECLFAGDGSGRLLAKAAAARAAGYSGDPHQLNSMAQKLCRDPRVQAAIRAETQRRIRSLGPEAIQALTEIVSDITSKDRLKAVNVILERLDPVATKIEANVTHQIVDHRKDALGQLRALQALGVAREKLEELFGYTGLGILEKQLTAEDAKAPIDVQYTEVQPDELDALELEEEEEF
jgi:phage terminase small subunit